jgi:hypothetical protein
MTLGSFLHEDQDDDVQRHEGNDLGYEAGRHSQLTSAILGRDHSAVGSVCSGGRPFFQNRLLVRIGHWLVCRSRISSAWFVVCFSNTRSAKSLKAVSQRRDRGGKSAQTRLARSRSCLGYTHLHRELASRFGRHKIHCRQHLVPIQNRLCCC